MLRAGAVAFSLLLAGNLAASAKGPVQPLNVGNWSGGAYLDDQSGAFKHCAATTRYRNGQLVVASVRADGGWALGIGDPRWQLTAGSDVQAQIYFDREGPYNVTARIVDNGLVEIPMPSTESAEDAFRNSYTMIVVIDGQRFRYSLTSTSDLMLALHGCVTANAQPGGDASAKSAAAPANAAPATNAEADAARDRLIKGVEGEYSDCVSQQMKDIVPFSTETAEVLDKVISMKCDPIEQRYIDLSMAIFNTSRADVEKADSPIEKRKHQLVAEIVTLRAAANKQHSEAAPPKRDVVQKSQAMPLTSQSP